MKTTTHSRVLPMEQPGAFYYKRAQRKLDQLNYLRALPLLREAVRRDPKNLDYRMELAETLTEMSLYDASNQVLFQILYDNRPGTECYFGLGCNFIGLQEYNKARESFLMYMKNDPDGEYREDVEDLMEWLDLSLSEADTLPPDARGALRDGKQCLDEGMYEAAILHFTKVLEYEAGMVSSRNNLALALHCAQRTEEAVMQGLLVLADHPNNVHALCNLALFYHALGSAQEALAQLEYLEGISVTDPDELMKLCATHMELGNDEAALTRARALGSAFPYDKKALHTLAAAYANCGKPCEAEECWRRILRIDPEDPVADWYLHAIRAKPGSLGRVAARFQVPHDEIVARIRTINAIASEGLDHMKKLWLEDAAFKKLLLWGSALMDRSIKVALLHVIALFTDADAEGILRAFLTRHDESDEVKRDVLGMLKQMGAQEPYIAIIEDALVEVRVSMTSLEIELPPTYSAVLHETITSMSSRCPTEDFAHAVIALWTAFAAKYADTPLCIEKTSDWCAALESAYWRRKNPRASVAGIARIWNVNARTARLYCAQILNAQD